MKKWIRIKAVCCITALLLLATTTLSPTITAKAEREGGGHQVEGGDGESTQRPTDNPEDDTTITINEDGTRTLKFSQRVILLSETDGSKIIDKTSHFVINGRGKFVITGYYRDFGDGNGIDFMSFLLSNEFFTIEETVISYSSASHVYETQTYNKTIETYKGVRYVSLSGLISSANASNCYVSGFINERKTSSMHFKEVLKADIDNGSIDLSEDNYKEPSRPNPDGDHEGGGHLTGIKISPLTDRDSHVTYGNMGWCFD